MSIQEVKQNESVLLYFSKEIHKNTTKNILWWMIIVTVIIVCIGISTEYDIISNDYQLKIGITRILLSTGVDAPNTNDITITDDKIYQSDIEPDLVELQCPHCGHIHALYPNDFNCHIFRCGYVDKHNNSNLEQIPPHSSQATVFEWLNKGLIKFGCGYPFKIIPINKTLHWSQKRIVKCGFHE